VGGDVRDKRWRRFLGLCGGWLMVLAILEGLID